MTWAWHPLNAERGLTLKILVYFPLFVFVLSFLILISKDRWGVGGGFVFGLIVAIIAILILNRIIYSLYLPDKQKDRKNLDEIDKKIDEMEKEIIENNDNKLL